MDTTPLCYVPPLNYNSTSTNKGLTMEKYYFLYKDSLGRWNEAQNPVFIASHQYCRAIPKEVVNTTLEYEYVSDLLFTLWSEDLTNQELRVLAEFDIHI